MAMDWRRWIAALTIPRQREARWGRCQRGNAGFRSRGIHAPGSAQWKTVPIELLPPQLAVHVPAFRPRELDAPAVPGEVGANGLFF